MKKRAKVPPPYKKPKYLVIGWYPYSNEAVGPHMRAVASPTLKYAREAKRDQMRSCEDVTIYLVGEQYE